MACNNLPIVIATSVLTVVVINLVINLVIVSRPSQPEPHYCDSPGHRDPACPYNWFGYRQKCYYISEKEMNWTSSEAFCHSHNSSLINVETDEKVFLMHFKGLGSVWSGLRRDATQLWKWPNGTKATLPVLGDGGDCAYVTVALKMELSSSRCSTEHRWICSKPDAFQTPKGA